MPPRCGIAWCCYPQQTTSTGTKCTVMAGTSPGKGSARRRLGSDQGGSVLQALCTSPAGVHACCIMCMSLHALASRMCLGVLEAFRLCLRRVDTADHREDGWRPDIAEIVPAWHRIALQGMAWHRRPGMARHGTAWHGMACTACLPAPSYARWAIAIRTVFRFHARAGTHARTRMHAPTRPRTRPRKHHRSVWVWTSATADSCAWSH